MAKNVGVWGIDVGQCALKALRCTVQDGKVVADAFDFIEYPKILSQPEAEPEQMIRDALKQFLSRNEIQGDELAIAVPGQNGLAKFFKPPPVDAKKIPEIVKYEARQQIPFPLEDVVWDYQVMGGAEVDGFALETEVGLFAMKRDQVFRALRPYNEADCEIDLIQLAPLAIYNFITHDILHEQVAEEYNPDSPPPSLVVLSIGTETTDLVITNGFRVWQRSIPLGGNHFTKQLTKELKLTFAKAEHLKRNARQAEDPKLVFQAMRPVFNDMVTEVQRSIGYFQGIDRKAKIGGVVLLGNTVKLPGLQQYLAKNLGYEVVNFSKFTGLNGAEVLNSPAFKDNVLSYGVCYGLCLQGLGQSRLDTNLVPREILTERLIRAKKPWAVACVGALLLACSFNFFFHYGNWYKVSEEREVNGVSWKGAAAKVQSVSSESTGFEGEDSNLQSELQRITAIGEELVGNADRRLLWNEMMKAVNSALPRTPGLKPGEIPDVEKVPISQRHELHVEHVEAEYFPDLATWLTDRVKTRYRDFLREETNEPDASSGEEPEATAQATPATTPTPEEMKLEGGGWVIELKVHHFFNSIREQEGAAHVRDTLLANLEDSQVALPAPARKLKPGVVMVLNGARVRVEDITPNVQPDPNTGLNTLTGYELAGTNLETDQPVAGPINVAPDQTVDLLFTMKELGVRYPVIISDAQINRQAKVPNPNYSPPAGTSGGGLGDGGLGPGGLGPGGLGPGGLGPGGLGPGGLGPGGLGPGGPGGFGPGGGSGTGGNNNQKDETPAEPQFLNVARYDCIVQFAWQEQLLTDRIEAQNKAWLEELEKRQQNPAENENLAVAP